jgi:transposase
MLILPGSMLRSATSRCGIRALVNDTPALHEAETLLRSGQAFGPIDAAVITLMPELGNLSPKAAAALAGLAPFNTESRRLKSNRSISDSQMARAQCALHGRTRCRPSKTRLAAFYKSLRNAGKAPKLALIALARKLLVILTAVLRDKTAFVPSSKIQLPACAGMTMRQAPRLRQP